MKEQLKQLLQEYDTQIVVPKEEKCETAQCCDDGALNNLCCLLNCLTCCNAANEATKTTTTTTPTYNPNKYAEFSNVVDPGGKEVSLLTGYNRSTGLYTFHLYSTYMKIAGWDSSTKIRTFYKVDYSNISSIQTGKPVISEGECRFFFTINFIKTQNYYVNDNWVKDANRTFVIAHCYGDTVYQNAMERYTENFVNQVYEKLNLYHGYEKYQYVKYSENVKTETYSSPLNSSVRPNFDNNMNNFDNRNINNPTKPVEQQSTFSYDYDEDDGYDYGEDE